jgi:hypothetical protein
MNTKEKGVTAPEQAKDSHFITQYELVYQSFKEKPKTMLNVSLDTGILRANICRYVADMKEKGYAQVVRKGYCPYTRHKAGFYSTDEGLFSKPDVSQSSLFDLWGDLT